MTVKSITAKSTIKTWDFPGGIYPPEHKAESNTQPIQPGPIPAYLIVPLKQHRGSAAIPTVEPGEQVLKGQLIAKPGPGLSIGVHAPSSGTVVDINTYPTQHPSQLPELAIKIKTDGQDTWIERISKNLTDVFSMSTQETIDQINQSGIAGLGGASFPTYAKLATEKKITRLIINAVECEPYISCDDRLMRERVIEIIQGAQIIARALNVGMILIGIEDNKPEAIEQIQSVLASYACKIPFHLGILPTKYPSGGEKQLIQSLTGKEIPSGKIPADLGFVCQNVGTCYAVKRALIDGEPLISRITTLTGLGIKKRGNFEVLIGTPVADLLNFAQANIKEITRLIMGGPMMGFTLHDPQIPIVKSSNCIIAGTRTDFPPAAPEQACIRCGHCVEVCPAKLLPQQLYFYTRARDYQRAQDYELMDCIECGACAYVCPSQIPLVQYYRAAKSEIAKQVRETQKSDRARERFEARKARLACEQAEKARRRQARLDRTKIKPTPTGNQTDELKSRETQLTTMLATAQRLHQEAAQAFAHATKQDSASEETLAPLRAKIEKLASNVKLCEKNLNVFQSERDKHLEKS